MPNNTNTNPLPWRHTHVVADITDIDTIKGNKTKPIVLLVDPDGSVFWCPFEDGTGYYGGTDIIDKYTVNNYQKIKANTQDLKEYLESGDLVNIAIFFNPGMLNESEDINEVGIDISEWLSLEQQKWGKDYNLLGVYLKGSSQNRYMLTPIEKENRRPKVKSFYLYIDNTKAYCRNDWAGHYNKKQITNEEINDIKTYSTMFKLSEHLSPGELCYIYIRDDRSPSQNRTPVTVDGILINTWMPYYYPQGINDSTYVKLYVCVQTHENALERKPELYPINDSHRALIDAYSKKEVQIAVTNTPIADKLDGILYFVTES